MTRDALHTALLDSLRMNRSAVLVILAYIASVLVLGRVTGFDVGLQIYSEKSAILMFFSVLIVLVPVIVVQLYRHRPAHPIRFVRHLLMDELKIVQRVIIAGPCILLFPVFSSAFTSFKSAIGLLHPYGLDPLFARLDSVMHGGHAWELIHPVVGFPIVTFLLNVSYNLWLIPLCMIFVLVTAMTNERELREQYLLSFFACWILLGSAAAVAVSSVGPCFYDRLYPADPYAPLMSYLRSVNDTYTLWALSTQDMLWAQHVSERPGLGSGISAMPSLHVAIATLNALLLSRLSRMAGILGWIYVALILVGSVHLGWHYAMDGYVSILAVPVIWWAAGCWAAAGSPEPAPVRVASA